MKATEQFLKVKGRKNLTAFMIRQTSEGDQLIELCFEEKDKYSGQIEIKRTVCPTEIIIREYSWMNGNKNEKVLGICFHESVYASSPSHIKTFLKAIKKTSDIKFIVQVHNENDNIRNAGLVAHQLIGVINGNNYLLSSFTGKDNTASPVKFSYSNL